MDFFEAREDKDGVRLSWSSLPRSKLQHQRNVVPMGSLYTPLNNKSPVPVIPKEYMSLCHQCRALINPFVRLKGDSWVCQFCNLPNKANSAFLYQQDAATGATVLAPHLTPEYSTVEYETGKNSSLAPIFFYVVDTCFETEDIADSYQSLRDALVVSLSLLPENALVGFVSFGKHVYIHELTSQDNISHCFNGTKEYSLEEIQASLGFMTGDVNRHVLGDSTSSNFLDNVLSVGKRFLQPVSLVEYQLTNIIESLVTNTFPHSKMTQRPERCTGAALNITSLLLKSMLGKSVHSTGGHLLCFTGGACTVGPGKIVNIQLKEPLRSHHDIEKSLHSTLPSAPSTSSKTKVDLSLFKESKKFFDKVSKNLVSMGLTCNFFIGSYDQVGLYEMDEVCYSTGGAVVMSDSFSTAIFRESFIKFFKKEEHDDGESPEYLDMGFNASLEIKTSSDLKIQGLIGTATALPLNKDDKFASQMVSTTSFGEGNTNAWKLCNVNPQSTYAVYFEKLDTLSAYTHAFIQYLFYYQHASGEMRLRVTTVPINIIADSEVAHLEAGFDQEAALVLIARDAVSKLQTRTSVTSSKTVLTQLVVLKQIDNLLVEFCRRFAVFTPGVMDSFRLAAAYSMLPQFLYHLRRSQFINVFNNSPDETSFIRHVFMHEDTANSLTMVQPTLLSYDVDTFGSIDEYTGEPKLDPESVLLDSVSLGHNKVLLLDTFFHILIFHGSKVAQWRKAGYHEMKDYEHFKEFLEAPKKEAMELLLDRYPLPRFIDCDEGGSQARFLMAKLNPSTSYSTHPNQIMNGDPNSQMDVLTDDKNLQSFMENVQRIVTSVK